MQVRAGKGLLGEELALPSDLGLSLDAMIHIMRRRKVLAEFFKVVTPAMHDEGQGRRAAHAGGVRRVNEERTDY